MYRNFFGLKENPFNLNPDPRYLYPTRGAQDALNTLTYGIESRKGFILLTGEVGTGKTTLLNRLLESLDRQRVATAFVFNPRLNSAQLFDFMMADFGITSKSRMKSQILFKLHQWLLDRYEAGEQTVLVVDEAQNLTRETLEEVRLLTNLETSTEKLMQVVLAGQPELEEKLNHREFRQLRQRIALRAKTLPLTLDETRGYILERLQIAGCGEDEIFTPPAIEALYQHAHGIPRVTNLLAEHALVRAFNEQSKQISAEIVENIARDFSLDESALLTPPPERPRRSRRSRRRSDTSAARRASQAANNGANGLPSHEPPFRIAQMNLPLFVYGYGPDGTPFYEQVHTIATNERGGLISMQNMVQPGQRLLITNKENECSQECVVEFLGAQMERGVDVGFEFSAPTPKFWSAAGVDENPAGESEKVCA